MLSTNLLLAVAALFAFLWAAYVHLIPKPHPTVPHDQAAARRLCGDIPALLAYRRRTGEVASFGWQRCRKLNSAVVQLFLRPGAKLPFLWLDDVREAEDILLRRTREFDRAPSTAAYFRPLIPHATIVKPTGAEFKRQRRLWHDTMSPSFLGSVVAPHVHAAASELVRLWALRAAQADGRPFAASHDLTLAAFDAIWATILGSRSGCVLAEIDHMVRRSELPDDGVKSTPKRPAIFDAICYMNDSMESVIGSPWPTLQHWLIRQTPGYRRFAVIKDHEIRRLVNGARRRFSSLPANDLRLEHHDTCAMDLVLRREAAALRSGKQIASTATEELELQDELLMLLVAGHETTAVTLAWAVKHLASNQRVQARLRASLVAAFFPNSNSTTATNQQPPSLPSAAAILLAGTIPYLEAFLEETLRVANTVSLLVRVATADTNLLGHRVARGTHVAMNPQPSAGSCFYHIPERLRSTSSQAAWAKRGGKPFDERRLDEVWPERWLVDGEKSERGRTEFRQDSASRLAFSTGVRGCFGRKLAMLELRVMIVCLVLAFEFKPLSEGMNSPLGHQGILRPPQQCFVNLVPLLAER